MTDKLECFVISPIGSPGTAIRKEADWVLRKLIHPALSDTYKITRADEFTKGEIITNKVITSIQNADLIVAVMAGHNPNVFYELAVAHAYSKPVVPLIKDGEAIPFDVGFVGTIFYSHDDVTVWDAAGDQLRAAADATRLPAFEVSNPITMALGTAKASASPDSSEQLVAQLASELAQMRNEFAEFKANGAAPLYKNAFSELGSTWSRKARKHALNETLDEVVRKALNSESALDELSRLFDLHVEREERLLGRSLTLPEKAREYRKFYEPLDLDKKED